MLGFLIGTVAGLLVGGVMGVGTACVCRAAHDADVARVVYLQHQAALSAFQTIDTLCARGVTWLLSAEEQGELRELATELEAALDAHRDLSV